MKRIRWESLQLRIKVTLTGVHPYNGLSSHYFKVRIMRLSSTTIIAITSAVVLTGCNCGREDEIIPIEEPTPELHDVGSWLGMALMPDGAPAVSFYDRDKGGLGFAIGTISADGVEWDAVEVDGFPDSEGLNPGDRGTYSSLAVDSAGVAWIAFRDGGNDTLRYANRSADGATWDVGVADAGAGSSPDAGEWTSIALDSNEYPVIAHYDVANAALRVVHWDGSSFDAETVDEGEDGIDTEGAVVSADVGKYANILINNGIEYIAYYDAANGALKLATGTAGNYTIETVLDSNNFEAPGDVGAWPSIATDASGNIMIACQDVGNEDLLLISIDDEGWLTEVVDDGMNRGADASLVLINGSPVIYSFNGYDNDLHVSTTTADGWDNSYVAGEDAAVGFHIETIDSPNGLYVASYDYTNGQIWFSVN